MKNSFKGRYSVKVDSGDFIFTGHQFLCRRLAHCSGFLFCLQLLPQWPTIGRPWPTFKCEGLAACRWSKFRPWLSRNSPLTQLTNRKRFASTSATGWCKPRESSRIGGSWWLTWRRGIIHIEVNIIHWHNLTLERDTADLYIVLDSFQDYHYRDQPSLSSSRIR